MKLSAFDPDQSQAVIALFTRVFSDSEGPDEGALIGKLVSDLIALTDSQDLLGFMAMARGDIVGGIFFSRLTLPNHADAFLLSPVAVATRHQGKGIGQRLITFGIGCLNDQGVDLVFTYGDPRFYSKVGFEPIGEDRVKAPLTLSHPEGWLGRSLSGDPIGPMPGTTHCVEALDKPEYW